MWMIAMDSYMNHTADFTETVSPGILNTTNSTSKAFDVSFVPSLLQFLFGCIGNALAIVILITSAAKHKWKPFYRLVFALTIADSTISVLVYPIVFKRYASGFSYALTTYECHHIAFVDSCAFLCSALLVTALSFDRFLAVTFPLKYNTHKYIRTHALIAGCWILAIMVCALPHIGVGKVRRMYPETWCFIDFASHDLGNMVDTYLYAVLGLTIFSLTVVFNLVVIIVMIKRIMQQRMKLRKQKVHRADFYVLVFVVGIVIVFSALWAPLSAHMIRNINSMSPANGKVEFTVGRLAITNQMIDPWIYIVLRKENFDFLERIIQRCKSKQMRLQTNASELSTQTETE